MKPQQIKRINGVLNRFGLRLSRLANDSLDDTFHMPHALARLARRGIAVQSIVDIGASNGQWSRRAMRVFPQAATWRWSR